MPGISRIIVGTSGSPGSLQALRFGEFLARAHNAALIPVIAWVPPGGDRGGRAEPPGYQRQQWQDMACQQLRDALAAVWGKPPVDPMVQPHVEQGTPGWILVNLACHRGDVLVIGAGRRSPLARLAWSSVSRYCLAHASCPVVSVPPPALAHELGRARLAWRFWHRQLTPEQVLQDRGTATT